MVDGVNGGVPGPPSRSLSLSPSPPPPPPPPLPPWFKKLEFCILSGGTVADLRRLESGFLYPDIIFNRIYTFLHTSMAVVLCSARHFQNHHTLITLETTDNYKDKDDNQVHRKKIEDGYKMNMVLVVASLHEIIMNNSQQTAL